MNENEFKKHKDAIRITSERIIRECPQYEDCLNTILRLSYEVGVEDVFRHREILVKQEHLDKLREITKLESELKKQKNLAAKWWGKYSNLKEKYDALKKKGKKK